ncbi:MAG: radical SAM protein [Syntrophobacteraceae bacterium]
MEILRAKTANLFSYRDLTENQRQNAAVNTAEMQAGSTVLESAPQRLVFELTNACNLSCIMCGRNARNFRPTWFNPDWLEKFAPLLELAGEVTLFGWGEPTLHPKFRQILEYLGRFPVKKYFLTNGMLLDRFSDLVVDTVDIMAVSLDGANRETNERIRKGADSEKIIANLRTLLARRNSSPRRRPHINFVMTLMKENLHELPLLVEFAHTLGIEEVKAVYLTAFSEELAPEVLCDDREEVEAVFSEAAALAERFGVLLKLPYLRGHDPAGDAPHKPCFVGWRDLFLGSDGFIRPCQSTAQKLFGLHDYPDFPGMWNSPEYQAFRAAVNREGNMPTQCAICYQSSYANWNRRSSFLQNEAGSEFAPSWEK